MPFQAAVPDEAPYWDDRCRDARLRLWFASEEAANADQPAALTAALGRLHAARRAFGAALLALDKKRRPHMYSRRAGRRS